MRSLGVRVPTETGGHEGRCKWVQCPSVLTNRKGLGMETYLVPMWVVECGVQRDGCISMVKAADAQATVEALQRERDEAIRHKEIEKALTNEQAGLVGKLQAALDAEREKRTALLAEIDEGLTLSDNLLAIRTVTALYDELAQLQALVRAEEVADGETE